MKKQSMRDLRDNEKKMEELENSNFKLQQEKKNF